MALHPKGTAFGRKNSDLLRRRAYLDTRHTTCMVSRLNNPNHLYIEIFP